MEQARDNINTFNTEIPLTVQEMALLQSVLDEKLSLVPCTSCRYCHDCPKGLDIPSLISLYNESTVDLRSAGWGISALTDEQKPDNCLNCGICAKVCPQSIDIPDVLAKFSKIIQSSAV